MNFVPKMNRRSFLVGSAAVAGGGLALGIDLPVAPAHRRATPELGVWVVVKPDDTVVVRIVRAEMGQGTITGLAQLVAEELEADWSKVTYEHPTPGESVKRKRAWGSYSTGGSRGIRESHEYVRQGGAAARMMLMQAAANEWKVPVGEVTRPTTACSRTRRRTARSRYGKVAEAASKLPVPEKPALKDPKDWKIAGKPLKRLETADKVTGKQVYGADFKLPGMLNATIKECPVFGGKVKSFDAAKVAGMKGVKKVLQVGETGVAVVADTWWQAKTALDALPIVWDEGPNAKVSSATIAEIAEGRPQRRAGLRRQPERRRQGGDRQRREEGRGGLLLSVPEPRSDGADERHRALHGRQVRGVGADAGRRGLVRGGARRVRPAGRQVRGLQARPRRRLRPARRVPGLRASGGPHRQGDAGHADQAALVARGGHGAGPVSPGHDGQAGRRARQGQQPDRPAHAPVGPVDPGERASAGRGAGQGPRSARLPGPVPVGRAFVRLHDPEPADRPCDAQPARPAGLLARREHQPELPSSWNASWTSWRKRRARTSSSSAAS